MRLKERNPIWNKLTVPGDKSCPDAEQGHNNTRKNAGNQGVQEEERGIKLSEEIQTSFKQENLE